MPLSIRNPQAENLAREVAAISGETLTRAIIVSLEERLERLRGRRTITDFYSEIMKISERCKALPDVDPRPADEILGYDVSGLPK